MRCFIGCSVSQRDKATLEALIQSRAGAGWRLIPPANYHLTLCFLGDQLPATLAALAERLRTGIPRRPGRGRALALAPFPTPAAPLVALELMPDAALLALHTAVVRCMAATGITGAASGFRPHITLARGAGAFRAAPRRGNCVCRSTNSVCFRVFRRRRAASMSGSTALRSVPMALPPRAGRMVKPAVRWPK